MVYLYISDQKNTLSISPHKNLLSFNKKAGIALGTLIVLGGFITLAIVERRETKFTSTNTPRHPVVATQQNQDSDGDRLNDWEEKLYGTNPALSDTDGDGTEDNDELLQGRHPLKPGPNDLLTEKAALEELSGGTYAHLRLLAENNFTRNVITNFFSDKKPEDLLGTPLFAEKALGDLEKHIDPIIKSAPQFHESAVDETTLIISQDQGIVAVKAYFNAVAKIYENKLTTLRNKDTDAVSRAIEEKNETFLTELSKYRYLVEQALKDVTLLQVPQELLLVHKKEIWYLQRTAEQITLLEKTKLDDPLYLILILRLRTDLKQQMSFFHAKEVPEFLKSKDIFLTKEDKASSLYSQL